MRKLRTVLFLLLCTVLLSLGAQAFAAPPLHIVFVCHGGEANTFWATVYSGMRDAAKEYGVDAVMYRPKEEGDLAWQLQTLQAAIAQKPDGIITTIPHPTMFNNVIDKAVAAGIPVIASNTDAPEGAKANARLAYIGQDLEVAGYNLAKAMFKYFPKGKNHILIGVEGPGLW